MSDLPWRHRVEVYAVDLFRFAVYGGIYDDDGTFGVFGGGLEEGENALQAAVREFKEESGLELLHPQLVPVPPAEHLWAGNPRASRPADRQSRHKGSRTIFVWGRIGSRTGDPSEPSGLHDVRWRIIDEVLAMQLRALEDYPHPDRLLRRIAALAWLKHCR